MCCCCCCLQYYVEVPSTNRDANLHSVRSSGKTFENPRETQSVLGYPDIQTYSQKIVQWYLKKAESATEHLNNNSVSITNYSITMPRSRGGSRPSVSHSAPAQSRSAHTAAAPAHAPPQQPNAYSHPQQAQTKQPGLFANMASTAAGVAVGSTIGHTLGAGITSLFGGSSQAQEQQVQAAPAQYAQENQQQQSAACDADARNFTRCLGENNGDLQICDYYLQQLKACQEASRQY